MTDEEVYARLPGIKDVIIRARQNLVDYALSVPSGLRVVPEDLTLHLAEYDKSLRALDALIARGP